MNPQLHINVRAPAPERIEFITQNAWHPNGGLWTFTHDPGSNSFAFWTGQFAIMSRPDYFNPINPRYRSDDPGARMHPLYCWILYPSDSSRVATIDTREDFLRLGKRYGWRKSAWKRRLANFGVVAGGSREKVYSLNFPAIAKDFDALRITDPALAALETPAAGSYRLAFWEAESTCWFRWSFTHIEEAGLLSLYMPERHGPPTMVLARRMRTWRASGFRPMAE
jgi:hypothetical protein